jgi:glutathione S-transferase
MKLPHLPVSLFGLERSVYTRMARLALEEKGVPYELQVVEIFGPRGVPPDHLARHPFGRIPVLRAGDLELYETGAITRFVDEAFAGPALQPPGPRERARVNQIIGLIDAYPYRPMVWGVFVPRVSVPRTRGDAAAAVDEAAVAVAMTDAAHCLQALSALMSPTPYLVGEAVTLADLHAFAVLNCFSLAPEGRALMASHPALFGWLQRMHQRSSVQRTRTSYEALS